MIEKDCIYCKHDFTPDCPFLGRRGFDKRYRRGHKICKYCKYYSRDLKKIKAVKSARSKKAILGIKEYYKQAKERIISEYKNDN